MGQRLCMEITRKGKPIANAYYHWSAYTGSSMNILEQVYDYLSTHSSEEDKLYLAIRALESTGAALPKYPNEFNDIDRLRLFSKYAGDTFESNEDRNNGLIHCFEESMQQCEDWAEEFCYIDIDTLIIDFRVACYYSDLDEVKEYIELDDDEDIPEFDASLSCCDIGTCRDIVNAILDNKVVKCDDGYYSEIG